jgi:hypothetical protein
MIILNMKLSKILLPTLFLCIRSFVLSFVCWFVRSCVLLFVLKHLKKLFLKFPFFSQVVRSFAHSFVCLLSCSLFRRFVCSFVCVSRKFHFFRHVRSPPAIKNCDFMHARMLARFHACTHARLHSFRLARTHSDVFLTAMPVIYILLNLGKTISLFKKYLGKKTQKTSGILYIGESKIQLLLELDLLDGDLIIYAEFDKTWYKR